MVENPWANDVLEHVHQVLGQMLRTAEIDTAISVTPQWSWCLSWQRGMGNLLYLSHSTQSLTRCSHFWTRHALQHFVCGWLAQNWRTQAITDWSCQSARKRLMHWLWLQGWRWNTSDKRRYPPQSRVQQWQRAFDYHNSSYKWNYHDSTWNLNGMT